MALSLELFDGSIDSREHVLWYHNSIVPFRIPKDKRESMMCKMFANSFKGPALTWYYGLKPGSVDWSVDSFGELSK